MWSDPRTEGPFRILLYARLKLEPSVRLPLAAVGVERLSCPLQRAE